MEYIFTTDAIPELSRELSWRNEFLRVFETGVQIEHDAQRPFQGRIRTRRLGDATLVNVQLEHQDARPHLLRHDPRPVPGTARPALFVLAKLVGQSRYHYDGGSKLAGPGDVLLFDGGQAWAAESARGKHQTLVLKLDREGVLARLGVAEVPAVHMLRGEQKLGGLLESYLRCLARVEARVARKEGPRLIEQFCELLAMAMQAELRNQPQAQARVRSGQFEAIREFVEQHLADPTLSPESVAARFGVSARYLHKLHSEQGQSFSKWLLQRRLERCRRDMDDPIQSQRSIAEIALDSGFNDLTHFGRCFRAAYGLTPREWRRFSPIQSGRKPNARAAGKLRLAAKDGAPVKASRAGLRPAKGGWLDARQAEQIRTQFAHVSEQGQAFADAFYQRFFLKLPTARELFRGDMAEQGAKLMRMIALLVTKAEGPETLAEPLAQLGRRHVGYGVTAADFVPMREALMETLAEYLAGDFDAEACRCWIRLFERVVALMQPAAEARSA